MLSTKNCSDRQTGETTCEIDELLSRAVAGSREARDAVITRALPWAKHIAKRYVKVNMDYRYLLDDLVSEAQLTLIKAIDDIVSGKRKRPKQLDRYLRKSMRLAVLNAAVNDRTVRIPRATLNRMHEDEVGQRIALEDVPEEFLASENHEDEIDRWDAILGSCLDDTDRAIVAMRRDGSVMQEVADALGLAEGNVSRRLSSIQSRMQDIYSVSA
jgi:RNA polymerase sigma factor (sigma-70 family)